MSSPETVEQLEDQLSTPPHCLVDHFSGLQGDLIFLGVGGKMGPTMIRMAQRALQAAGTDANVFGVSRFSNSETRKRLDSWGIQTIAADLRSEDDIRRLPRVANVVYLAGFKFGTASQPSLAWVTNCLVPSYVCQHYTDSRIVALSSGNVYPLVDVKSSGSVEADAVGPVGEYAMTTLGRERIFQHFCETQGTPTTLLRLNYATELRYGVLVDIAELVCRQEPIDLSMSHTNVIWLADANWMKLMALPHCTSPASVINLAGGEILSIRNVAETMGEIIGKQPVFHGEEGTHAYLNNGTGGHEKLGAPLVSAEQMIRWTIEWVDRGGASLGKPTHFQETKGSY